MKIDLATPSNNTNGNVAFMKLLGGANDITQLPINMLLPFANHPFKPYNSDKLFELAHDIQLNGVYSPIIVRPKGDKYEILAGHNRVMACRSVGLETIPAIIKDVDDDTAILIMTNTNLNQRDRLLHSEKAFAYKMQIEAMKRKGGRPKNVGQVVPNSFGLRSTEIVGEIVGDSYKQIQRYIRLTYLLPTFLTMVDVDELPFIVGVNLSYLSLDVQTNVKSFLENHKIKGITVTQSELLKLNKNEISDEVLESIFVQSTKESKAPTITIKIPQALISTGLKGKKIDDELLEKIAQVIAHHFDEQE